MAYWLFKSEPETYPFARLQAEPRRETGWDGVRNYQARNFLRDDVRVGDGVLFYHSSTAEPGIAGLAEVVRAGHPDPTAADPGSPYHDPKSTSERPIWYQVTIRSVRPVEPLLRMAELRTNPALAGMELLKKGSRLSIQPVRPGEWAAILGMIETAAGRI